MLRRRLLGSLVGLIVVLWASGAVDANDIPHAVRADLDYLRHLVARDPERDARASVANGNLGFLGVAGYAVLVPAGEEPDIRGCLRNTEDVKIIRGTSDVVYGDEHQALIKQVTHYAARYNAVIAKQRGMNVAGGCGPFNSGVQQPPSGGRR